MGSVRARHSSLSRRPVSERQIAGGVSLRAPAGGAPGQVAALPTTFAANGLFTASQVLALAEEMNRRGTAPTAATTPTPAANASMVTAPTLMQSMNDWLRASQQTWATKAALEYRSIAQEFAQWAEQRGVRRVAEVSRVHGRDYRTWLLEAGGEKPVMGSEKLAMLTESPVPWEYDVTSPTDPGKS